MSVLSREDNLLPREVVLRLIWQRKSLNPMSCDDSLDKHDEAQRQRIAELEAANAEICKRAKVWQDEVGRLESEKTTGEESDQLVLMVLGDQISAARKERDEARAQFNDLHADWDKAYKENYELRGELASLRLRVQEGEKHEFGIRLSGCETPITVLPEHVARQMVAAMPNTYFLQSRAPAGPWVAEMASEEGK